MDDSRKADEQERGVDTMEKSVAVKVPLPALLDIKAEALRSNPSFVVTCFSTLLTAVLLGLCFMIVGVPPLYIAARRGRCIYVGVMVPLLTVIGTVLSYYAMQHPQRVFNSALAQIVKETEQHAAYLSTAVNNVETELETRRVTLGLAYTHEPARMRSLPMAPEESGLQRFSRISMPAGAAAGMLATLPAISGPGLLHGIDELEEERGMIIATVHVGKEWRWLMGLLGKLNLRSLTGSANPVVHHQRIAVRALVISVARVERMILSLYFSSFVLNRANAAAAVNPSGLAASKSVAGCGSGFGHSAQRHQESAHGRTSTSMFEPSAPIMTSVKLHPSHKPGHELGDSSTESVFTVPRETPNESRDRAESGGAGEEMTSQLTSLNVKGLPFGRVKLPQFPPLLTENTGSRKPQKTHAHAHKGPSVARGAATASAPVQRVLHLDTDAQVTDEKAQRPDKASASEHSVRSLADTNKADEASDQGGGSGDNSPLAVGKEWRRSTIIPSSLVGHAATLCIQSHTVAAAENAANKAFMDGNAGGSGAVLSHCLSISAQHPEQQLSSGGDNGDSVGRSCTVAPHSDGNATGASPISSPRSRPRLARSTHSRQPGSAVVANPSLTLNRGARFIGDENSVFATVLIHVEKGNSACGSRLYGAQAHASYDASANRHYFTNGADSSLTHSCGFHPFTIFYISNHKGQRERLTTREQQLLEFVYCRPEEPSELDSVNHRCATDLSSLAVRDTGQCSGDTVAAAATTHAGRSTASFARETANPPSSTSHHASNSVFTEPRVDSFIVAMQILQDRPMRLTFLPVVMAPVQPKGTPLVHNDATMQPLKAACRTDLESTGKELHLASGGGIRSTPTASAIAMPARGRSSSGGVGSSDDGATNSTPEAVRRTPSPTTVPVLECVIDDVLCILTEIEITVDTSFKRPSKVLLNGVSLEDVSEEGSERGEIGVDEDEGVSQDSVEGSTGSQSLYGAGDTKQPTDLRGLPRQRAGNEAEVIQQGIRSVMATPRGRVMLRHGDSRSVASLNRYKHGERSTLGQEFSEVIHLE
ncbi:hypothetical protein LMJF_21_1370 [Leishmania major strain Friedlin]|uniref:Uncharacterized protein n=1 Tax=Leishmania major TaxID=5664 RepID=Q4QC58_LEIMA|nr:hypothetical protein LMJF_21_1370 [Leishmania major strain Friedlin]CAG9573545.1 hypothetical_protein_-_conserved [Leishmania major strain Friedlin]CAJ04777.1 hypothetical protein LMJF_21_1370 [Leishmania major strain Friedlin]|eukprot:XP_001683090.1 hypothetical protein LMJF_21_1370 [Leishmania major strain Friedlin]